MPIDLAVFGGLTTRQSAFMSSLGDVKLGYDCDCNCLYVGGTPPASLPHNLHSLMRTYSGFDTLDIPYNLPLGRCPHALSDLDTHTHTSLRLPLAAGAAAAAWAACARP